MLDDHPKARKRLSRETIGWLTTVSASGQPQTSPVWFLLDADGTLLVYSLESPRVRNLASNPLVSFHLDGDGHGGNVVTLEGEAKIDRSIPPASEVPVYIDRYRGYISAYGWTPESFAADYPVPIRIRITRVRAG